MVPNHVRYQAALHPGFYIISVPKDVFHTTHSIPKPKLLPGTKAVKPSYLRREYKLYGWTVKKIVRFNNKDRYKYRMTDENRPPSIALRLRLRTSPPTAANAKANGKRKKEDESNDG